jgi:hypothetical protein
MRPCPVPRTARKRATDAPQIARPVALTPWQSKRHRWPAKQATFHLRHDDRVKRGAPRFLNSYPFLFSLSLATGTGKGDISKRILLREGNGPPSPPTDQRFEGCALRGPATTSEHSGPRALLLIRGSKVAPCGVQQLPQTTRAPEPSY